MQPNNQSSMGGSGYVPPPPPNRPKWIPIVIGCCSGCALIVIVMVVLLYSAGKKFISAFKETDDLAKQFMRYVGNQEDDKAYAMVSPSWSQQDFQSFAEDWQKRVGALKSATFTQVNANSNTQSSDITLVYNVVGSVGSGQVTIVLVKEGEHLRVKHGEINSNSLPKSDSGGP